MNTTLTQQPERSADGQRREAALCVALDCAKPTAGHARHALHDVDVVLLGRRDTIIVERQSTGSERQLVLGLADRWMSSNHARLSRVMGRWLIEDQRSKNGVRVNQKPIERVELDDGDVIEVGRTFLVFRASQVPTLAGAAPIPTFVPELRAEFERLAAVAHAGNVPVLIEGETGTGKELAARAAHQLSKRSGPFVPVNCGALPRELLESQLFGHVKGAFTGAVDERPGLVRSAHKGTLFLDEIGELPLSAQPALLRVLQEREVTPVGATRSTPVDLQLVAATHRDLEELVEGQTFRADLLARLQGLTVTLPPLRERLEDLGLIVTAVLERARHADVVLSLDAGRALFSYDWPMNIRELEKALLLGVALAQGKPVELSHLPEALRAPRVERPRDDDDARKRELVALLREHHGNVSAVARAMGKARMQVQRWLKRFALDPTAYR